MLNTGNLNPTTNLFKSKRASNYMLALLCLTYMFDYADRMIMAALVPHIKADWNLIDQELGMLTGIVSLFIAIFVLPLSFLVDRWSRRKMISVMVFLWSIATLACSFASDYNHLLWLRAFTGLGEAGYAPAALALIAAAFSYEKRAKVIGIWDAFAPLGSAIGMGVGAVVATHYGWRHALGIVAIPGIILSVLFWFSTDYKTVPLAGDKSESVWRSTYKNLIKLLKIKSIWFVFIGFAANLALNTSMIAWVPSYLNRSHGFDLQFAGLLAGLIAMFALIGAPLGGQLADRWMKKQIKSRMLVPAISSLLSAIFLLAALLIPNKTISLVILFTSGVFIVGFLAPASAVIQDVVHPGIRAVAFGINVVLMNIFGAFPGPVLVGTISDKVDLHTGLLLLPVFGLIAFTAFLLGAKYYKHDLEQVEKIKLEQEP